MSRFTEEEAQRIFARAAERQHAADDAAPGFSLDELQEIGQAAGLSPEHIAAAVADVRSSGPQISTERTVMGIQTDVQRSRVIPGEMTDELWEGLVSRLRRTFKTQGITADVGRTREWTGTNSTGGLSNLHVVARPVEEGTQITMETSKTDEARQVKWLPVVFVFMTAFFPLLAAAKGKLDEPALWVFTAFVAAIGALGFFGSRQGYKTWSERRQREFEALLDDTEAMARLMPTGDLDRSPEESATEPLGRVIDDLADAPEPASEATRSRTRA